MVPAISFRTRFFISLSMADMPEVDDSVKARIWNKEIDFRKIILVV